MTGTWTVDTGTISTYNRYNNFKKNAFSGHKILTTYVSRKSYLVSRRNFYAILVHIHHSLDICQATYEVKVRFEF